MNAHIKYYIFLRLLGKDQSIDQSSHNNPGILGVDIRGGMDAAPGGGRRGYNVARIWWCAGFVLLERWDISTDKYKGSRCSCGRLKTKGIVTPWCNDPFSGERRRLVLRLLHILPSS